MKNLTLLLSGLVFINIPVCLSQNNDKHCFSETLKPSYPCCKGNKVVYTDKDGDWGVEDGKWCGIGNEDSCFSVALGYSCCESCQVIYTDKDGDWGVENGKWCGMKDSCTSDISETDFEFSFLKIENNENNMLYSPLSIEYALNMLKDGAVGNTYDEIDKVIGNRKLNNYTSIDSNLLLANGLYIRDTYYKNVRKEYIKILKEKYDADVVEDEFEDAKNINKWIEDKTLGIIKDMLSDETVKGPDSVMFLINALTMDLSWDCKFDFDRTYGETFYLDSGEEMKATMMFNKELSTESVSYHIDDNVTVLTMDLTNFDKINFEFMAIMPNQKLSNYVKNISKEQISQIDKNLKFTSDVPSTVNVKIPKFKFNYDLDLKNDLINLGIKDAFKKYIADFSKMALTKEIDENLYVDEALHTADIEFTEKGVKAAAVSIFGITRAMTAMPRMINPINIVINKPFMFIIRDKSTKDIWFTGTVYKPNSWEDDHASYGK